MLYKINGRPVYYCDERRLTVWWYTKDRFTVKRENKLSVVFYTWSNNNNNVSYNATLDELTRSRFYALKRPAFVKLFMPKHRRNSPAYMAILKDVFVKLCNTSGSVCPQLYIDQCAYCRNTLFMNLSIFDWHGFKLFPITGTWTNLIFYFVHWQ